MHSSVLHGMVRWGIVCSMHVTYLKHDCGIMFTKSGSLDEERDVRGTS